MVKVRIQEQGDVERPRLWSFRVNMSGKTVLKAELRSRNNILHRCQDAAGELGLNKVRVGRNRDSVLDVFQEDPLKVLHDNWSQSDRMVVVEAGNV